MKHTGWLVLEVLLLATSLFAQNPSKGKEMSGTICNSACVEKVHDLATCNTSCTDKSGDCVLVDDLGKIMKIENQKMALPHVKQHVKVVAVPSEKEREEALRLMQVTVN